jgi:pyridinium-3,5-bisthiocarboxylic acid mononucleotide nickel chelatase
LQTKSYEIGQVIVDGCRYDANVKISSVNGEVLSMKPEYEDLKRIVKKLALPLRKVNDEMRKQFPGGMR